MAPESGTPLRREDLRGGMKGSLGPNSPALGGSESRKASLQAEKQARQQAATARLKRRLNWVMVGLVAAIVVVYLILFFVG